MRSIPVRVASLATFFFGLTLLAAFAATSIAIAPRFSDLASGLPPSRILDARGIVADSRNGTSVQNAAPKIVDALAKMDLRVAVYTEKGEYIAGDRELRTPTLALLAAERRMRSPRAAVPNFGSATGGPGGPPGGPAGPAEGGLMSFGYLAREQPVPTTSAPAVWPFGRTTLIAMGDGFVVISSLPPSLWKSMGPYWLELAAIALCALVLSWFVIRFAASEALRPLATVAPALRSLADGDDAKQTIALAGGPELAGIAEAYNDAASRVANALGERARMRERMRQFVADAGHELRTPLTVIAGYIDILRRGAIAEPKVAMQILTSMSFEKEHMRSLIDRLIRLSRLDAEAPARRAAVDLEELLRVHATTARHLDPTREVAYDVDGGTVALADRDELGEALWNVVENALKYAPGAPIAMRAQRAGANVVVSVADRGPGMSETERLQAFERFFRGDARGEVPGSGLGLAIAKRAVERSGGTIELRSVEGSGTTALITLPAAP